MVIAINIRNLSKRLESGEFGEHIGESLWKTPMRTTESMAKVSTAPTTPSYHTTSATTSHGYSKSALTPEVIDRLLRSVGREREKVVRKEYEIDDPFSDAFSYAADAAERLEKDELEKRQAQAQLRNDQRNQMNAQRLETCRVFREKHLDLCGTSLQRKEPRLMNSIEVRDALTEILHLANFNRDKFGYNRHVAYNSHIESLVNKWDSGFHAELVQSTEAAIALAKVVPAVPNDDPVDFIPDADVALLADEVVRQAKGVW